MTTQPITLRVNLADYPHTRALRDGRVTSDLVRFDFCGPDVAFKGFKAMVDGSDSFDGGELALATFLQARSLGKPWSILPATMSAGHHHESISYNSAFGDIAPKDVEGRRVAVRSYTQTTGVWVRGFLEEDFGVDLAKVVWIRASAGHVAEYSDPPNVIDAPPGADVGDMLVAGEVQAYLAGVEALPDAPGLRPLIPNPEQASADWQARHGTAPINHPFVLRSSLLAERPDVVRETYRMLSEARQLAGVFPRSDYMVFGFDNMRPAIDVFCRMALSQRLVDRPYSADELFADAAPILIPAGA